MLKPYPLKAKSYLNPPSFILIGSRNIFPKKNCKLFGKSKIDQSTLMTCSIFFSCHWRIYHPAGTFPHHRPGLSFSQQASAMHHFPLTVGIPVYNRLFFEFLDNIIQQHDHFPSGAFPLRGKRPGVEDNKKHPDFLFFHADILTERWLLFFFLKKTDVLSYHQGIIPKTHLSYRIDSTGH